MRAAQVEESPRQIAAVRDPDTHAGGNDGGGGTFRETPAWIGAETLAMELASHPEGLGQFAWAGAEGFWPLLLATPFHDGQPMGRFQRPDQDEAGATAFDQHIGHPMHAVIEIDISGACRMILDKLAGFRAEKGVTSGIVGHVVSFRLNDSPPATVPNQLSPKQLAGAGDRVGFKKSGGKRLDRVRHMPLFPQAG